MSEAKPYTPGPWEVAHAGQGVFGGKFQITEYFVRLPGADFALASDITDAAGIPSEANARLIAAAPDLLAACGQASFALRELLPNDPDAQMTVRILQAAIAKATGASHV